MCKNSWMMCYIKVMSCDWQVSKVWQPFELGYVHYFVHIFPYVPINIQNKIFILFLPF